MAICRSKKWRFPLVFLFLFGIDQTFHFGPQKSSWQQVYQFIFSFFLKILKPSLIAFKPLQYRMIKNEIYQKHVSECHGET